jgi:hypothetical protein
MFPSSFDGNGNTNADTGVATAARAKVAKIAVIFFISFPIS